MHRTKFLIPLILIIWVTQIRAQVSFGEAILVDKEWKFILKDEPNAQSIGYNHSGWKSIDLPHDWSVKERLSPTLASCQGYLPAGIGWYRKSLLIPDEKRDAKIFIYIEGIYNRSEVYINGQLLGKRPNGYISFMYDVSPYVKHGGENIIAVRVDHSRSADSRWYTGSGIYRDVYLVYSNAVHIDQWGVFAYPKVSTSEHGILSLEVNVKNESSLASKLTIQNELLSAEGEVVARLSGKLDLGANQTGRYSGELKIKSPQLWDLDNPNLYTVNTSIIHEGKVIDRTSTKTGFRSLKFDPNKGFALNEKWLKVKGVCIHHDAGVLGSAVPKDVWKRRLLNLKEIGVNAIRTSHNPQAPALYDLCDELGILVMNEMYDEWEFPKRKWIEGWNVGNPGFEGSFDYFEEWAERDLADFVCRDRNHISIFAWSIGNEVDYPNDPYSHPVLDGGKDTGFTQAIFGGYKKDAPDAMRLGEIAKKLTNVVKQYDKSRPTTAGLAGVAMSNQTEYPNSLDITGYNYTESLYDKDHQTYPKRVIYGSENRHDYEAWLNVKNKEYIFGQFLWTGIDYLGESGSWPSRGFYSGLLDFGGFKKPRGYYRQSLWSDKPMAYLGTYPTPGNGAGGVSNDVWSQLDASQGWIERTPSMDAWSIWNYNNEGQLIRVVCYTNCAKARLTLNGIEVGQTKSYDKQCGIIYWDIPYKAGKLEVEAMDERGIISARYAIESTDAPYQITANISQAKVNKEGIVEIYTQVEDKSGRRVMLSDNEIECRIAGNATLRGMEGSNNSDMTDYTDNKHRVYHGAMVIYIKAGSHSGKVQVKLTSAWLKDSIVEFEVK